ncbi:MAG: protein kinase [Actinomycetota bacterium]|nr:protein kinase [Actinomycetota bacterium]
MNYFQHVAEQWNLHGGEPVNDAESMVIRALVDGLPDDHTVIPSISIPHHRRRDEIDAIVVTPHVLVLVETKGIYKPVRVTEQLYEVGGERRDHPVNITELKAKRLKGKVVKALPDLKRKLWVHHQVVFAWQPPIYDVEESMKRWVCLLPQAVGRIADPELFTSPGNVPVDLPVDKVLQALGVGAEARRRQETFKQYRTNVLLEEDPSSRLYEAEHLVSERPVRLRLHLVDQFLPRAERDAVARRSLRAFRALTELEGKVGWVPQVVGPVDAFVQDDGHVVTISPADPDQTLEDLAELGEGLGPEARLAVIRGAARAIQAAHGAGIAHRQLSPDVVHVDRGVNDPTKVMARVGGWDLARIEDAQTAASRVSMVAEGVAFVAPEVVADDVQSWQATDLWNLGTLARWIWNHLGGADEPMPDRLAEVVGILTSPDPDDREGSSAIELGDVAATLLNDLLPSDEPLPAPDALDLVPGGRVGDQYSVVDVLGSGATGTVVAVDDLLAGMRFAIKVFAEGLAHEAAVNEFGQLLQVQHRHVVRVLDLFQVADHTCLKMELLLGPSLRALLDKEGRVSRARIDEWLDGLLAALEALHGSPDRPGIVHRDLKPENIVIGERGPVIVDFGLASSGEDVLVGGSGRYRPAMAAADSMDPTIDLFALAVIVHEALTGVHPFGDEMACRGEPTIDPSVEGRLGEALARAMAPEPERRFPSATEFREALLEPEVEPEGPQTDPNPGPDPEAPDEVEIPGSWLGPKVALEVLPGIEERVESQTPGGEADQRVEVTSAVLRSGADVRLDIEYCEAENGERWVHAVDAHSSPACVHRLVHGLRPGIHRIPGRDDVRFMELRQARIVDDPEWPRLRKVPMGDLDNGAATGVEAMLLELGAGVVNTREVAWGDEGRRRSDLCVVFDAENVIVAMAAYALTRLAPLVKEQPRLQDPVPPEQIEPSPPVAAGPSWPSLDTRMSEGRGGLGDRYLPSHGYWVCHERNPWRIPRMPFSMLRTALFGKDGARAICAGEGRVADRTAKWGVARLVVVRVGDVALLTDGSEVALLPWERVPPKDAEAAIRGFENATARRPLEESAFD